MNKLSQSDTIIGWVKLDDARIFLNEDLKWQTEYADLQLIADSLVELPPPDKGDPGVWMLKQLAEKLNGEPHFMPPIEVDEEVIH